MNKILRYSFVALLAMVFGNLMAEDVFVCDFSYADGEKFTGGGDGTFTGSVATNKIQSSNADDEGLSAAYAQFITQWVNSSLSNVYWANKSIKLGTSSKDGTMTSVALGDKMTSNVKVTINVAGWGSGSNSMTLAASTGTVDNPTVTLTNKEFVDFTFNLTGCDATTALTISGKRMFIKSVKVETAGDTPPVTIAAPKFSVASGTYYKPQTVAMTCDTEGAKILYTIPAGNDPEYIDDNNYTGVFYDGTPLTITKTTTIKAMAVKDGQTSSIVSATYTIAEIEEISVAKALEIINALENGKSTTEEYQVKGFIVGTPDFQRKADESLYGNVNFTIADEKGGTTTLTVFRAKDLENVNFTEETINRIKEGDEVVVQGKLQKYVKNEVVTPELTNGYLISVTAGEDPDPGIDPSATIYELPISKFAPWDGTSIEGNVITMGAGWKGGAIYVGGDMTQFDYVWIKFKNATGTPNFGITYDEWTKNESWGPVFAAVTTAMDGTGMVGIKLDKKTVMVHGNAETGGVGIGDVYAQHVQQITIQGGNSAASVEVEGIWFGTTAEFVKAGGDVPVRPEAGGALTMWEGELVYDGWGVSSTVDPKYFEVAQVGDIIYCSVKDVTADYNPIFKYQDWSDFTDIQATLAKDETHFEGKIATAEALDYLQKNGLRFQGVGFTLTKVELKVPDPSGVNTINVVKADNGAIYNVAGQKVNAGYKGLVIKNGKKFVNK
ncbi:MAG: chitobiase/beta-hexosaminidase C-terminal domain-containing protein [Prevotella sp.]|nr:chitobiase/beta-hexosaminidase C-terminal domain-containing protein [Prevotella sp.]